MSKSKKRSNQQLEQVVDVVLEKMQLFQGDAALLTEDFEGYRELESVMDALPKVWLIQKLAVLKDIATVCENQQMLDWIADLSIKEYPLTEITNLFVKVVPIIDVDLKQVKKAICCADIWESFEINNYDIEDIFEKLDVEMGGLTENFKSGKLKNTYRNLLKNPKVETYILQEIISNAQEINVEDEDGEESALALFEKELFSMIEQFCKAIEGAGLKRTPYDSLEYIAFSYDLEGYGGSYCWFEDEIFKSALFPKMEKKLKGRREQWCIKLLRQIDQITGICSSWYLDGSQMVRTKKAWYFPAFICVLLEDSEISELEESLNNWNGDLMCRVMALSMLLRYMEKSGGFKKRKLPRH